MVCRCLSPRAGNALARLVEFDFLHGNPEVHALLPADAQRLKRNRAVVAADEYVAAAAEAKSSVSAAANIAAAKRAIAIVARCVHGPNKNGTVGVADIEAIIRDAGTVMLAARIAREDAVRTRIRTNHIAGAAINIAAKHANAGPSFCAA